MTTGTRRAAWVIGLAALAAGPSARGQILGFGGAKPAEPEPSIQTIHPPGVALGGEAEWTVRGQGLGRVERWLISGRGLEVVEARAPDGNTAVLKVRADASAAPGFRELRALAPGGLSNLVLVRVDSLPQVAEAEPNDDPSSAQPVEPGVALAGTLTPRDIDHARVEGRRGTRLTVEVEARRLGRPLAPVLTLLGPTGAAIAQASRTPGLDGDARLSVLLPEDGPYTIRLHDNLYGGAEGLGYRLRIERDGAFATGLHPLGGRAGETVTVEASGGTLDEPRSRTITLPDDPGLVMDVGPFDGPGGPVPAPQRFVVGGGTELAEPAEGAPAAFEPGAAVNGRIGEPGEVDRYTLKVKKGESVALRVRAAELGSWLDSVVRVVGPEGRELAINDDEGVNPANPQPFNPFNPQPPSPRDSRLSFNPEADGEVVVEVFDRFGQGGPEYGYRLEVGSAGPDFQISLLFGDPNLTRRLAQQGQLQRAPRIPGANGSLTLRPGQAATLQFLVTGTGGLGTIEVHAEGLPLGVTAAPVKLPPPAFVGANRPLPPSGGAVVLKVDPRAGTDLGEVRIVATATPEGGPTLTRVAKATVLLESASPGGEGAPSVPVGREVEAIPAWVAGDPRPAALRPGFVGPPEPVAVKIEAVANPGVVLQGGRADLDLTLEPALPPAGSYRLEATTGARGLGLQTLVTEPPASGTPDPAVPAATVRVVAEADAPPGPAEVAVVVRPAGRAEDRRVERVEVRPPFALRPEAERLEIGHGAPAALAVAVAREAGADGPIRLELELPEGVEVADASALTVPPGRDRAEVALRLAEGAGPPAEPVALGLTGTIRMPRGQVRVVSAVRPLLSRVSAEEK
jgi:hypothetical protein